jgi:biotin carboxyl carrier protein
MGVVTKMVGNGNSPDLTVTTNVPQRRWASGPFLFLALLFLVAVFLSWYFTWFGRGLSDADISTYLNDERHPRRVQHALLQVQQRIERSDTSAKQWYSQVLKLSDSSETEFRLTVAWLMGFDNQSEEFHRALLKLLADSEPVVSRNAALALLRFRDASGRNELHSILEPYPVRAKTAGVVASTLRVGSEVSRGTLLARVEQAENTTEIRSPLPGTITNVLAGTGNSVSAGDTVVTIQSDEASIWEALRGLSLVGQDDDLPLVERFAQNLPQVSVRITKQAALTAESIQARRNTPLKE